MIGHTGKNYYTIIVSAVPFPPSGWGQDGEHRLQPAGLVQQAQGKEQYQEEGA